MKNRELMTWAEFKRRMEAAGVRDDHGINYIDIHGSMPRHLVVSFANGVSVLDEYGDDESAAAETK